MGGLFFSNVIWRSNIFTMDKIRTLHKNYFTKTYNFYYVYENTYENTLLKPHLRYNKTLLAPQVLFYCKELQRRT